MKFKELDIVRVRRLGRVGRRNTEGSVEPSWVVGQEAIIDSYFVDDGVVMVWLEEPEDGWSTWIFEEVDLEATGRSASRLPDDWD